MIAFPMDGWLVGLMDEWMDGWTDRWTDRWMDGQTDGWMECMQKMENNGKKIIQWKDSQKLQPAKKSTKVTCRNSLKYKMDCMY